MSVTLFDRPAGQLGAKHPRLAIDLKQMENGPLEQLRDRMMIRERILDTALQTAQMQCDRERIAVDLAEELGTLNL